MWLWRDVRVRGRELVAVFDRALLDSQLSSRALFRAVLGIHVLRGMWRLPLS